MKESWSFSFENKFIFNGFSIDETEFRNWLSKGVAATPEFTSNEHQVDLQNILESTANISPSYGTTTAAQNNIYNDPNPKIFRRPAPGGPVTYQQKILVRFLQPPAVPPPGVKCSQFKLQNPQCLFLLLAIDYKRSTTTTTTSTTTTGRASMCKTSSSTTPINLAWTTTDCTSCDSQSNRLQKKESIST